MAYRLSEGKAVHRKGLALSKSPEKIKCTQFKKTAPISNSTAKTE